MAVSIYKSFDSSESLFESLWRIFPNILVEKNANKSGEIIIKRLISASNEFCNLLENNSFNLKKITEGGFGIVSNIGLNNKMIKAAIFSHGVNSSNLFYTDAVAKISKGSTFNEIYRINMSTISISDPLSDMVFGSALGHLFDIGVCPFIAKYFGTYLCQNKKTTMIMESADIEILKAINRHGATILSIIELKNILCQFIYCVFILKLYYGAIHFDSHLRNVMLIDLNKHSNYLYHGKEIKNVKYILFETGLKKDGNPLIVAIKKSKYMVKLIDYGCMALYFDRSRISRFKRDMKVETSINNIQQIGAVDAIKKSRISQSYANTVDILFTLINLYQFMAMDLDGYKGIRSFRFHINVIDEITNALFGFDMKTFIANNSPNFDVEMTNGKYDWFMRNHSTGIMNGFDNPKFLMAGLANLCSKYVTAPALNLENEHYNNKLVTIGFFEDIDVAEINSDNMLFLVHNAYSYQKMLNRMEQIIKYQDTCTSSNDYENITCKVFKMYDNAPLEMFTDNQEIFSNGSVKIFYKNSSYLNNPTYKTYNSWASMSPIPPNKINNHIEDIRMMLISMSGIVNAKVYQNNALTHTSGISVPVGIFGIFKKTVATPLGIYANYEENKLVRYQHIPNVYHKYLGVLLYDGVNIKLEKYLDFVNRHETHIDTFLVDKDILEESVTINAPITIKSGSRYKWAITVGPILVWNSKSVFTEDIMKTASSETPIYGNSSDKLFMGVNSGYFNMNDCHLLQTHLIYIESRHNQGFLLVEGGGFMSSGIDRPSAANLCRNLGAVNAVCISSGFAANVLVKTHVGSKYLSKSPIRIKHGAVLNIAFNNFIAQSK